MAGNGSEANGRIAQGGAPSSESQPVAGEARADGGDCVEEEDDPPTRDDGEMLIGDFGRTDVGGENDVLFLHE